MQILNRLFAAPAAKAAQPIPAPTRPEASKPAAPGILGRDRLEFSRRDADQDGYLNSYEFGPGKEQQELFRQLDLDHDGRLGSAEFLAGMTFDRAVNTVESLLEKAAQVAPPAEPTGEETLTYTLKNDYDNVDQLATDLGTDGETLRRLNGWDESVTSVPAGTELTLPATPETTALVEEYSSGSPSPVTPAAPGTATPSGNVPFISQLDPAGNDGSYTNGPSNCGPTSMAMVARAFGYGEGMTDAQLINHLGAAGGTTEMGTNHNGIHAIANFMGLPVQQAGLGGDAGFIQSQLEAGKVVVVNGNFGYGGHYVVVTGMDASGNFLVNDPYEGPRVITPAQMEGYQNANVQPDGTITGSAWAIG